MGKLVDRPTWEAAFEKYPHLLLGLERNLPLGQDLTFEGWFDDGRSGSPVARVLRTPSTAQLILKFFPSRGRADQMSRALDRPNRFVADHLARLESAPFPIGGGRYAAFMRVAGDNLATFQSMAQLRRSDEARSDIDYRGITKAVIGEWNDQDAEPEDRTVRWLISGIVGRRRPQVIRWIRANGDPGGTASSFFTGDASRRVVKNVLVGKAHGDLSGRNILIPNRRSVDSRRFQLIDYDHYAKDAPLARDPMHLLVALALDDFDREPADYRANLISAIVDPDKKVPERLKHFRKLSRAIHEGCAEAFPPGRALGDLLAQQCLLSLVGVALVHIGRDLRAKDRHEQEAARRWCYDLAEAAATSYHDRFRDKHSSRPPAADERDEIVDRFFEKEALTDRLAFGPHGVMSVQGATGVGKSKLVDVVVDRLRKEQRPAPRLERHHATTDRRFDVPTLVDLINGQPAPIKDRPGAALIRLEAALKKARDPVVIVVESAEHLLDQDGGRLVDLGLEDAFALLNAKEDHNVSVILETPHGDDLRAAVSWPAEDTVRVPALGIEDFFELLASVGTRRRWGLERLSAQDRHDLWCLAEGNPRVAQLVYATVSLTPAPLPALLSDLRKQYDEPAPFLLRAVVTGMHESLRLTMRALAAFGTPVPLTAVQSLMVMIESDQVEKALSDLHFEQLVRQDGDLFAVPPADAAVVLDLTPRAERRPLLLAAARILKSHVQPAPRSLNDLRYHFAQIRATIDAEAFPLAQKLIDVVDGHLRSWNCTFLLLNQRLAVRGKHDNRELERINENALAGIYVSLGKLRQADTAYGRALAYAGPHASPEVLGRLHANLGALHWASNNIDMAQSNYEYGLSKAIEADDAIAQMGALRGLADCHRRRGDFETAIQRAGEAFDIYRSEGFAELPKAATEGRSLAVGVAVRLSRWHAEQERLPQANDWLDEVHAIVRHGSRWHLATYLDAKADLLLYEHLRDELVAGAVETAGRAVDLAFEVQDRVILLRARTTLCVAHLCAGRIDQAAKEIAQAGWHRTRGRNLVVLGLTALAQRLTGNHHAAERLFVDLRTETGERIANDFGFEVPATDPPVEAGPRDFGARHFQGFARCGLVLTGRAGVASAVESFRMPELARPPHAPGLVDRMVFMLELLDRTAARPGILRPALEALRRS